MNVNSQTILPSFSAVHNKKSDWLPSDVSISAWIDASDSENYTRSGTSLETVTDKSGTYSSIKVKGDPTTNTSFTLNGLNVFYFDGGVDALQSETYETQVSSGNHWAIGVFRYDRTDNTRDSFWSYETDQSPKRDYAISSAANNNTWPGEIDMDGLSSNRISSDIGNQLSWTLYSSFNEIMKTNL